MEGPMVPSCNWYSSSWRDRTRYSSRMNTPMSHTSEVDIRAVVEGLIVLPADGANLPGQRIFLPRGKLQLVTLAAGAVTLNR